MSFVNMQVPNNLMGLLAELTTLAEKEPLVIDHVVPILQKVVEYGVGSGKASNPEVWIRALEAAVTFVETRKLDDKWLPLKPLARDPIPVK